MPGMRASLTVAAPEPDSEATSASTDLPLAESDAAMSPDPVSPLPSSTWPRSAPASLNCVETSVVPSLFLASNRPVSSPPSSLPLRPESLTPSRASAACMCASSRTPKIPADTEPKVMSRSAVKRRRDLRLEGHGRPAASSALQCRLADQHGSDGSRSKASIARSPVRCGRPSLISALTSPETGPSAISPLMLETHQQRPWRSRRSAVSDTGVPMPMPGKLDAESSSATAPDRRPRRCTLPLAAGFAVGDAQITLEARLHVVRGKIECRFQPVGDACPRR